MSTSKVEVILSAKDKGLARKVKSARTSLDDLKRSGGDVSPVLSRLTGVASNLGKVLGVVVAGSAALVVQQAKQAREFENLARLAQVSTAELQALSFATNKYGIDAEKLADITNNVTEKVGDFVANGGGEFADFFKNIAPQIGQTAEEMAASFNKMDGVEVLIATKKALDEANVSYGEQVSYLEAVADDATKLIPLLEQEGAKLKEAAARAKELGVGLDSVDEKNLRDAADAADETTTAFHAMVEQMAARLSPGFEAMAVIATRALTSVSDKVAYLAEGFSGLIQSLAGWEAVVSGRLSVFEFATMDAKELHGWLQKDRSELGKIEAQLRDLTEQRDNIRYSYSDGGESSLAEQRQLDAEISALKTKRDAIIAAADAQKEMQRVAGDQPKKSGGAAGGGSGGNGGSGGGAGEGDVVAAIREQQEELRLLTATALEAELAGIEKNRQAELAAAKEKFANQDLERVNTAINQRFDAEAAQAKQQAAEETASVIRAAAEEAAKSAQQEAEAAKALAEAKRAATLQSAEVAAGWQQLKAEQLSGDEAYATEMLTISRNLAKQRIAIKEAELADLTALSDTDQAAIMAKENELSALRLALAQEELDGQRTIAAARLADLGESWRQSTASVEAYKAAVEEAYQLKLIDKDEYTASMTAAGTDIGAALRLGFTNALDGMQTDAEVMMAIGEQIPDSLATGLTSVFSAMTQGYDSAKDAMLSWASSTLASISEIILKQMILNALQSITSSSSSGSGILSVLGFSDGGSVQALAGGGSVGGYSPSKTADNIPAWLTAKEFVHPVKAVEHYGLPFMEAIRTLKFPKNMARALSGGTLPRVPTGNRLAAGGSVAGKSQDTTVKSGDTRLRVVNVLDKNMVGDYLKTSDGETAIINMIRRNGTTIKTVLG